mmetsp:Transcript_60924/g.145189  ORF Transcript_60924/g.145189 Transcript_60924/m.145189 type:complete len:105 (+) Transcript_60924:691-1005(+)
MSPRKPGNVPLKSPYPAMPPPWPPILAPSFAWKLYTAQAIRSTAQLPEQTMSIRAALYGLTPQQYIKEEVRSFAPSAGYIGKNTLNKNKPMLSVMAMSGSWKRK